MGRERDARRPPRAGARAAREGRDDFTDDAAIADLIGAASFFNWANRLMLSLGVAVIGFSLAGFALLGWMSAQGWFYRGLGVEPNVAAPNDALALLLFLLLLLQALL